MLINRPQKESLIWLKGRDLDSAEVISSHPSGELFFKPEGLPQCWKHPFNKDFLSILKCLWFVRQSSRDGDVWLESLWGQQKAWNDLNTWDILGRNWFPCLWRQRCAATVRAGICGSFHTWTLDVLSDLTDWKNPKTNICFSFPRMRACSRRKQRFRWSAVSFEED